MSAGTPGHRTTEQKAASGNEKNLLGQWDSGTAEPLKYRDLVKCVRWDGATGDNDLRCENKGMTTGYSGTPLVKKLGIKIGFNVVTINAPENYRDLIEPIPDGVKIADQPFAEPDLVHLFTNSRDELFTRLAECFLLIKQDGSIWVSWYKKAAKRPTEITEGTVREAAFPLGLVDVKVCAVDEKWSGLKLVIRKENRCP